MVKNLTDANRVGTTAAPFKLGDQLLITYRLNTRKLQNFVALEDALPAGLEVVNPNLALVAKFFQLPPPDPQDRVLALHIDRYPFAIQVRREDGLLVARKHPA